MRWPSNREGLVYLFETGDKPNQVPSADGRPERGYAIRPRGRARLNHAYAMVLAGGSYLVDEANNDLLTACRKSNQLTVEAVIHPDRLDQSGPARIVTFSSSAYSRNFTLGQERDKLIFRLRTPKSGDNGVNPETAVCSIRAGSPLHVVVTYQPGRLVGYVDGKEVYRGESVQGDLSNWAPHHLVFGDEFDGNRDWSGTLEGVAIYSRALEPGEIQRNAAEYRNLLRSRKPVPRIEVAAKLVTKSAVPTLKEVKPYRDALMVCKYRVTKVMRGNLKDREVLVTQWALLDGRPQAVASLSPGSDVRMVLEPSDANPQLKRFVCKDGFDSDRELLLPRYYDASPERAGRRTDRSRRSPARQKPMVFSSHIFVFYFLPLALALYYAVPRRGQHVMLIAAQLRLLRLGEPAVRRPDARLDAHRLHQRPGDLGPASRLR